MRAVVKIHMFFAGLLCLGLTGCDVPRTDVTGEVTYNDKPITESPMGGTITFHGPDGKPVTTAIDAKGKYLAKGVCIGENRVAITYQRPIPKKAFSGRLPKAGKGADAEAADDSSPYLIPDTYVNPDTSELKVTIERNAVYNPKLTGPEIAK